MQLYIQPTVCTRQPALKKSSLKAIPVMAHCNAPKSPVPHHLTIITTCILSRNTFFATFSQHPSSDIKGPTRSC